MASSLFYGKATFILSASHHLYLCSVCSHLCKWGWSQPEWGFFWDGILPVQCSFPGYSMAPGLLYFWHEDVLRCIIKMHKGVLSCLFLLLLVVVMIPLWTFNTLFTFYYNCFIQWVLIYGFYTIFFLFSISVIVFYFACFVVDLAAFYGFMSFDVLSCF